MVACRATVPDSKAEFAEGVRAHDGGNHTEAVRRFRVAAELGNADAQYNLGVLCAKGQGVPQDYKEAVRWLDLAAESGHTDAQYTLGSYYNQGLGVPQDSNRAAYYWGLAANPERRVLDGRRILISRSRGHAEAQFNLGIMYRNGQGVPQNYEQAVHWWHLAADQGHAEAQFNLGVAYAKNNEESAKWWRLAADQGNAEAQFNLGNSYAQAEGVPRDYAQAYKWFRLAAVGGSERVKSIAMRNGNIVAAKMTSAQIAEGNSLALSWTPKKVPAEQSK